MTKNLQSDFLMELVSRLVFFATYGSLMLYLARELGSNSYGVLFLAITVFGVARLFGEMGIAQSAARYISEIDPAKDEQIGGIIVFSLKLQILFIVIVCGVLLLFSNIIASILNEPHLEFLLKTGVLYIFSMGLYRFTRVITQGYNDLQSSALLHSLEGLTHLLCVSVLVGSGYGPTGAIIGYAIGYSITACYGFYIIHKHGILMYGARIESSKKWNIIKYNFPIAVTQSAYVIDRQIDTILVGVFLSPIAVSYYVLAKQISHFVETPAASLGYIISPSFGSDSEESLSLLYSESLQKSLIIYLPAATALFIFSEPVIDLAFGVEYHGAVSILKVFSIYVIFDAISKVTGTPLDYLGKAKFRSIAKLFTSSINFGLNLLFIPIFGVVGAAFATIITHGIYAAVNIFIIVLEIDIRLKETFLVLLKSILTSSVLFIVGLHINQYISNTISLVIGLCVFAISTLFLLIITKQTNIGEVKSIVQSPL